MNVHPRKMRATRPQHVLGALAFGAALTVSAPVLADLGSAPLGRSSPPAAAAAPAAAVTSPRPITVLLEAGSGRLIHLPGPASTILAADPRIARVQAASPTSIFVMGVAPGHTTVVATAESGAPIAEYDVTIRASEAAAAGDPLLRARAAPVTAAALEGAIRRSLAGMASVRVTGLGTRGFMLSGTVANAAEAQRAEAVARSFAGEREIVNSLELLSATQVNVRVRVAEISRQITRELGFNWQALGKVGSFLIGLRTGSAAADVATAILSGGPSNGNAAAPISRIGVGASTKSLDVNAVIDALAADQLITILAEPNLTAQSGETASFLAGGEFPIPVGTSGLSNTLTVEFKQYGVSLAFVPTVLGSNRLNLRIRPEVSELSENGSVSLPIVGGSITIPALQVRRAETTVELGSGQSFAIAGLLQRTSRQAESGVLGLGDLPIIGPLFRSTRFIQNDTELVIIVTPYLVRPTDGRELTAPTDGFRPATDFDRLVYQRQIARGAAMPALRSRPDAGFIVE